MFNLPQTAMTILFLFTSLLTISQENNSVVCADGIDNDGDGNIDCEDEECLVFAMLSCDICASGISFADEVISYESGCSNFDDFPEGALGTGDYLGVNGLVPEYVFLGEGGHLSLKFTNNLITNSGDSSDDLHVFEVGPLVEAMHVYLRPADVNTASVLVAVGLTDDVEDGFYFLTRVEGATSSIDVDLIIPGQNTNTLFFDAIRLEDIDDRPCNGNSPGADIDAVCALSFVAIDCNGTINGTAVIDECGECLEPNDPIFNQSCVDCNGVPNGLAVLDTCGLCLLIEDELYNQSCIDCPVYVPNIISLSDPANKVFTIFNCEEINNQVQEFEIYDRWGSLIFRGDTGLTNENGPAWNGLYNGQPVVQGVYTYSIVLLRNQEEKRYFGTITVLR